MEGDPGTDSKVQINLNEKQLGTLIAYMIAGFGDRELVKRAAKNTKIKHLDNIDDEFKFLMSMCDLMKKEFIKPE